MKSSSLALLGHDSRLECMTQMSRKKCCNPPKSVARRLLVTDFLPTSNQNSNQNSEANPGSYVMWLLVTDHHHLLNILNRKNWKKMGYFFTHFFLINFIYFFNPTTSNRQKNSNPIDFIMENAVTAISNQKAKTVTMRENKGKSSVTIG